MHIMIEELLNHNQEIIKVRLMITQKQSILTRTILTPIITEECLDIY